MQGFGKEVYDIALRINQVKNLGKNFFFSDDTIPDNKRVYLTRNYSFSKIVADFDLKKVSFVIANGEPASRKKILEKLIDYKVNLVTLIDPSAIVSNSAKISKGTVVCQLSSISSSVKIKSNVVCNRGAIIGHDVSVGNNSIISPYCVIGGNSKIGKRSFIGSGSLLKEKITIGNDVIIGMGSVVYKNIENGLIVVGNPARISRKNEKKKIFNR